MESECVADIEDTGGGGGGGQQKPHVRVIVGGGNTRGAVIACKVGLSFWGGVDPSSAEIIDQHHPSRGHTLAKKVCMCITHLIQTHYTTLRFMLITLFCQCVYVCVCMCVCVCVCVCLNVVVVLS